MILTRIILCFLLITSFYTLPTPSKVYSHYSYHYIKNACMALIKEHGDALQAVRYIVRLNTAVANKVADDLVKEGVIPKKYGYELKN